ncbi:MAG: hypothetical protein ACREP9_11530 [Candidatus Dormibacteraceae bacterium]
MSVASPLLAAALHRLDLGAALTDCGTSDLLPSRIEDVVAAYLPDVWIASLEERIRSATYSPSQIEQIYVPKTRFTTRPAALARFEDRVVFESLTNALREPVELALVSDRYLYWPRGLRCDKRWQEFKQSPLQDNTHSHIVIGDIAGFYESIDHALLQQATLDVTGWADISSAIAAFISELMGKGRGLPQGLNASDVLATLYLATVDAELAGNGLAYTRHGDDVRIGTQNYGAALVAAHDFEIAVRRKQMFANDSKLGVRLRDKYDTDLNKIDTTLENLRDAWAESAARSLAEGDDDADVTDIITQIVEENPEFEEVGWEWYRGDLTQEDLIELIRPHLSASVEAVALQLLRDTVELRPGGGEVREEQLSGEQFSERFNFALTTLRAANNSTGISHCEIALTNYPEQTENICKYLISVAVAAGHQVAEVCTNVLRSDTLVLDWQTAWLYRTLAAVEGEFPELALKMARRMVRDDSLGWLARVEASKFLATNGHLALRSFRNLWRRAPEVYKPDLIEAAALAMKRDPAFIGPLQLSRSDSILRIIADRA